MTGTGTTASRRIRNLAVAVVGFTALYSGAWYYGAHEIRSRLQQFMVERQAAGLTIECGNMEVKGFPFRFEIFCTNPGIADLNRGGSADAAALRTAAQVYQPFHVVWEMDGPLDATLATGEKLSMNWSSLQSSLQLKMGGLERSSVAAEGFALRFPSGSADEASALDMKAEHAESHVRQNNEDLDAAFLARKIALKLPGTGAPVALPVFDASVDATLVGKAGLLDGRIKGPGLLRPATGEIRRAVADFGEGRVTTVSGPLSIDEEGLISGKLSLEAEQFEKWEPLLTAALPDAADNIRTAMGALKAMADSKGTVRVNLVLDKGQVLLGFIPTGIVLAPL